MKLGVYSVEVPEGHEVPDGFVEMRHGETYTLTLGNVEERRCDARVVIDGIEVGCFRVEANSRVTIDHPVDDTGLFTFYRLDTPEAARAEIKSSTETGLISVTFHPEKPRPKSLREGASFMPDGICLAAAKPSSAKTSLEKRMSSLLNTHAAGGTGLSGHSTRTYGTASAIDHDVAGAVTIHLRLICLKEAPTPRPIRKVATPIPPPLT